MPDEVAAAEAADVEVETEEEEVAMRRLEVVVILPEEGGQAVLLTSSVVVDPNNSLRASLVDLQQCAHYTNYRFELVSSTNAQDEVVAHVPAVKCHDWMEIGEVIPHDNVTSCTFQIVPELFCAKAAKVSIKRTREILATPPTASATLVSPAFAVSKEVKNEEEKVQPTAAVSKTAAATASSAAAAAAAAAEKVRSVYTAAKVFDQTAPLEVFYDHALMRTANTAKLFSPDTASPSSLSDLVRAVSYSGWNPVPPHRKLMGCVLFFCAVLVQCCLFLD
jgi:hypothetical protein